jgi:excisionase family DNA binding protein
MNTLPNVTQRRSTNVTELLTTTHEAARRLGIGRTKLFELLKEDRLRAVRLGSKTLIPVAELENFAATLPLRNGKSTTKTAAAALSHGTCGDESVATAGISKAREKL